MPVVSLFFYAVDQNYVGIALTKKIGARQYNKKISTTSSVFYSFKVRSVRFYRLRENVVFILKHFSVGETFEEHKKPNH